MEEQKISDTEGGLSITFAGGDDFGDGVAPIGDLDDDGVVDLLAALEASVKAAKEAKGRHPSAKGDAAASAADEDDAASSAA